MLNQLLSRQKTTKGTKESLHLKRDLHSHRVSEGGVLRTAEVTSSDAYRRGVCIMPQHTQPVPLPHSIRGIRWDRARCLCPPLGWAQLWDDGLPSFVLWEEGVSDN